MNLPLTRPEALRLGGLLALLCAALTALFHWQPGPVGSLSSAVSDTYYRFNPHTPSQDIVFIAVDHDAVKRFGRWPWPRDVIAQGMDRLAQARVIALDMVFSEPTEAAKDRALAASFGRTTAVGGFLLNGVRPSQPGAAELDRLANSALTRVQDARLVESRVVELSIPEILAGQAALASLNTLPDHDERFRHYPAAFLLLGMVQPSLGVQSLQVFLDTEADLNAHTLNFAERRVRLDERGFTRLNFYPETRFRLMSFADLFAPGFDPASLVGKIVLLGVTEAGVTDIRATPLGQYPGALLHATFMANVLDGHTLREIGPVAMAGALALVLTLVAPMAWVRNILVRAGLYLALAGAAWGAGLLLYLLAGVWLESAYLLAAIGLSALLLETALLSHSRQHTEKLRLAFSTYLPPGLVSRIVENPEQLRLGGEKKEISVLFSDIRGFTSMSEGVAPERLAEIMARYFQPMTEAVFAQGGALDKYIGDAIMALFNAPLDQPDHALAACRAAVAMQYAQRAINADLARIGGPALRTGIGINTGPAIVGNLGSSIRFNYTAIGDVVNLASRFESATKKLGVDVVIGESTWRQVKDALPCRPLGEIQVAGKEQPQTVYELCWQDCDNPGPGPRT
ncbi:MAG: adenylate/guanylate cyclase domain-containing protein [Betaproteobacteria bacterium]|nr:adenylate/guanylate cyclase domain-containing protein [Betaproteobacteria bacterium]